MNNFTLQSGDKPLEGYTVERPIGHGGFGEVYHAKSDAGKDVALKLVQRFLEIELRGVGHCLNLKHPNLVTIYDVRPDANGRQWIIMEYVAGRNLAEVLEEHPEGMPQDETLRWFEAICLGVDHLHTAGIVHRDLKPGNVFDDAGTVKVGDYGLSKFITASKRSAQTQSVGTVHYMAPEVGSGRYGREVDVYAVGVMLYELLTGKVPYDGETPAEILMKHLTATPDLKVLPTVFQGLVARMLAKNPNDRYSSLAAALSDLKVRLADAAHAEATGDVSQYPAYDEAVVSRPGVSEWLEAPFEFLKNLGQGGDAPARETPAPLGDTPAPMSRQPAPMPVGGFWSTLTHNMQQRPFLSAFCVFLTMAMLTIPIGLGDGPGYRAEKSIFMWLSFSVLVAVAVAAWAFLMRGSASRPGSGWQQPPGYGPPPDVYRGWSDQPQSPSDYPEQPQQREREPIHAAADVGDGGAPVHMGETVRWNEEMPVPAPRRGPAYQRPAQRMASPQPTTGMTTFGGVLVSLIAGGGTGLLTAGLCLALTHGRNDEMATLTGVGGGFLVAGLVARRFLVLNPNSAVLRVVSSLFCGLCVGLLGAGLLLLFEPRRDEEALFLGFGAGLFTAGMMGYRSLAPLHELPSLRLFTSLFAGLGAGLFMAGFILSAEIGGRYYEDVAGFFAGGVGTFTAGLLLSKWLGGVPGYGWTRFLSALFWGLGVGLFMAGMGWLIGNDEDVAGFLGGGSGLLAFGIILASMFAGRPAPHHPQQRW